MRILLLTTFALAACGPSHQSLARRPHGYAARMEDADAHSERAEQHRRAAAAARPEISRQEAYNCGDVALSDQATSGGERLVQSVPCWDVGEEAREHQRYLAAHEDRVARTERRDATNLVETELAACRGMSPREVEHSPFAHHKEIESVIPHREAGALRGVRIVFKPVPGLTAAWMRQAIACHRARFARLGEPTTYLPDDPTLVAGTSATVELRRDRIEVLIQATDDTAARVALDRAEDLTRARAATR